MWGMVAGLEVIANIYNIRPRWKWLENDSEFRVVTSESLRGDPLLSTLRFLPRRSDLPDQADIDRLSATAKQVIDLRDDFTPAEVHQMNRAGSFTGRFTTKSPAGLLNLAHLLRWSGMHAVARALYTVLAAHVPVRDDSVYEKTPCDALALLNYAEELERGLGGPLVLRSAIAIYEQSALDVDSERATFALDALQRLDPSKDFRTWAAKDQYKYGMRHRSTHPRFAHKMWRLAADGGNHAAMEAVAILSHYGQLFDVAVNFDEARRLYASAVEARYVRSALSLGLMHATGQGGPQNLAEARRLFVLGFEIAKVEAEADPVLLSLDVNPWADAEGFLFPHASIIWV